MAGIAALAVGYVLSQFFRSFLAVLTPLLVGEIGMTKADLAAASGAWFAVFALAQFGVGVSLDRFGPRVTTAVMLGAGGGAGAFLFSAATEPWMVIAAMALIGLGCGPVLMAALFIFARSYSPGRFAVLASWMVAFGTAGNVVSAAPLANAAEAFGWRPTIFAIGVFTVVVSAVIFALLRDPPPPEGMEQDSSGLAGYVALLKLRALWPLIPITALNYAPTSGIRGLWAGPYLTDVYGADSIAIGNVTVFMAMAMVAGAFLYGPLDQIFRTRKWVAVAGNLCGVCVLGFLALHPAPGLPVVTLLLVSIGITGGSYGLLMAHSRAFVPAHLIGRGVTLMNFFSIGGVGLVQFCAGAVVTGAAVPGDPTAGYSALFGFYVLLLAGSVAVYLFARDAPPERRAG